MLCVSSPHSSCGISFQTRNETKVRTRVEGESAAETAKEREAGRRENPGLAQRRHGASQELTSTKNWTECCPNEAACKYQKIRLLYQEHQEPFQERSMKNSRKHTFRARFLGS